MKKLLTVFAVALVLTLAIASVALAVDVPEGKIINWGELDTITSIGGHTIIRPAISIQEPTCTEGGWGQFDCTEPNCDHYHWLYFPELGHDWSSAYAYTPEGRPSELNGEWGNIIKKPTCTETGLAIDVCYRCHIVNPEVTRVIEKLPHVFAAIENTTDGHWHYVNQAAAIAAGGVNVIRESTCVTEGISTRICLECHEAVDPTVVNLWLIPHDWTDWNQLREPTCDAEGYAERACIVCGVHQKLTQKTDAVAWGQLVQRLNPNWNNTLTPILNNTCLWERVRTDDWLTTCYTHNDVYTCPFCHGASAAHDNVVDVNMPLRSHKWKPNPEPVQNPGIDTTGLFDPKKDIAREQFAWDNHCSVAPTCLYYGYNLYMCVYDNLNGYDDSAWLRQHDGTDDHRFDIIRVDPLGHDWDEWKLARTYKKDGKDVFLYVRGCKRCTATEEQVTYQEQADEATLVNVINLSASSKTLKVGKSFTLKATVNADATNKALKFKSSNSKIAKVSSKGKVTALKKGTCYITVSEGWQRCEGDLQDHC